LTIINLDIFSHNVSQKDDTEAGHKIQNRDINL